MTGFRQLAPATRLSLVVDVAITVGVRDRVLVFRALDGKASGLPARTLLDLRAAAEKALRRVPPPPAPGRGRAA